MFRKRLGLAVMATLLVAFVAEGFVVAADQTTWQSRSNQLPNQNYCIGYLVAGRLNFCHLWNNSSAAGDTLNTTSTRDSDLRSVASGVSQDKYNDNYIVGTVAGSQPNTYRFSNRFSSGAADVCLYTAAGYGGTATATGWTSGLFDINPGTGGLMAMKSC